MAENLSWERLDLIAERLQELHPRKDPRDMSDDELRRLVLELPGFSGTAEGGTPGVLEALRATWYWER
jgi:FeS assembly protein IscX